MNPLKKREPARTRYNYRLMFGFISNMLCEAMGVGPSKTYIPIAS